jgi:hypothetical protein
VVLSTIVNLVAGCHPWLRSRLDAGWSGVDGYPTDAGHVNHKCGVPGVFAHLLVRFDASQDFDKVNLRGVDDE